MFSHFNHIELVLIKIKLLILFYMILPSEISMIRLYLLQKNKILLCVHKSVFIIRTCNEIFKLRLIHKHTVCKGKTMTVETFQACKNYICKVCDCIAVLLNRNYVLDYIIPLIFNLSIQMS